MHKIRDFILGKIIIRSWCYKEIALFLIIILSLFHCNRLKAQRSFNYYLEKAYNNNPALREFSKDNQINEIDKELLSRQFTSPSVSLTSNYMIAPYFNSDKRVIGVNATPEAIGYEEALSNGGLYSVLLNVQKNLFYDSVVRAYQKTIDAASERNNFEITVLKHQIRHDITSQYLACIQQIKLYGVNLEIINVIENELNIIRILVENGSVKNMDYLQLEVESDNQRINLKQILSGYYNELSKLNNFAGIADTSFQNLEPLDLAITSKKDDSELLNRYRLDSIDILASLEAFQVKYKPAVNAFFNTGLNAIEITNMQRKFGMSGGFNFSWILYDGNLESLAKQKSDLSLMNIKFNMDNYLIMRENQLTLIAKQSEMNKKILEDIKNQSEKYMRLLETIRLQLSAGQTSAVDYLTSLRSYLELKKSEISTEINEQQLINEYNYWNW